MPQTDGRTLWVPRDEIHLQIIQQKWKEGEGGRAEARGKREQIQVAKRARGRGTKREARTEPGCA